MIVQAPSEIAVFLLSAVAISLSGVMAPGSVTAATIAQGATRKAAGALIAIGHGLVEFTLMFAIISGFDVVIQSAVAQIGIGIAGGLFLLWMGGGMIRDIGKEAAAVDGSRRSGPIMTGVLLSAGNPYFLLWWATVGLALATDARRLGWAAFVLFMFIHWLCDLVWLGFLGYMSFRGLRVLGGRVQKVILAVCGGALVLFGIKFVYSAAALCLSEPRGG